jgi:Tfp pilus assembly protein FimT
VNDREIAVHVRQQQAGDRRERGQSLTEFAFILALIAIVAILALFFLDDALADLLALVGETVE